ncbi:conserved hypothetical protein, partial [Ricinus communis]
QPLHAGRVRRGGGDAQRGRQRVQQQLAGRRVQCHFPAQHEERVALADMAEAVLLVRHHRVEIDRRGVEFAAQDQLAVRGAQEDVAGFDALRRLVLVDQPAAAAQDAEEVDGADRREGQCPRAARDQSAGDDGVGAYQAQYIG